MSMTRSSLYESGTGKFKKFARTGPLGLGLIALPIQANLIDYWVPDAAHITKDGNNRVSDFVGVNGNHFSQASGSYQILWGANGANGLPYLYNDNAGRYLLCNSITQAKPFTAFALIRQKAYVGSSANFLSFNDNAKLNQNGTSPAITFTDSATAEASTTNLALNAFKVITIKANTSNPNESIAAGTSSAGTNNGSSLGSVNTTAHKIVMIGDGNSELYAYGLYSGIMPDADISLMLNYFKSVFVTVD